MSRLLSHFPGRLVLVLFVLVWVTGGSVATAQSPTDGPSASGRVLSLGDALERLATTAEVSLVYDTDLVNDVYTTCAIDATVPEATLRCVLDETGLDFVQTSGGTYVVKADVRRPPKRGTVTGRVQDAETRTPLSNAHVRAIDSGTGTVTDERGRFWFSNLVSGPHSFVVTHLGYETDTIDVTVPPEGTVRRTLALAPGMIAIDSLVVDASEASSLGPSREHAVVSAEQVERTGGGGTPSVSRAAGTLMGITTRAPYADLHVQGGASSEHEVRLDGVPVRNPAAAGRLLGAFSSLALDGVAVRKAGFGALQGDALSGLVELDHDVERPDTRHATVQVDPVSLGGRAEGSTDVGDATTTAMASARTGLWTLHQSHALTHLIDTWSVLDPVLTAAQLSSDTLIAGDTDRQRARPDSRFYDVHAAVRTMFDSSHRLYVSGYHGRSVLGADLVTESPNRSVTSEGVPSGVSDGSVEVPTSDRYGWENTVAQATYEGPISSQSTGRLQASLSRYRADSQYELGRIYYESEYAGLGALHSSVQGASASNAVTEIGVEGTIERTVSDRKRLTLKGGMTSLDSRFHVANPFIGRIQGLGRSTRLTAAGEGAVGLGSFTTLEGGVRLTMNPNPRALFVEPRVALRHHRPRTEVGEVAVRVAGGLYRRYTTQFELSRDGATAVVPTAQVWMPVPQGLTPPRTYHVATNLHWGPHPAWSVAVEGYAKWQPHLLAVDYPALRNENRGFSNDPTQVLSPSQGRGYGGGLRVSYEGARATSTIRYTYSQSRRTFPGRFDGRMVPTPWNEPHRLTLDARLPLGGGVAVDLQGNGIWGRSWGYQRAYYAYLSSDSYDGDVREEGTWERPAEHVLPPLYRVDASLEVMQRLGGVDVTGRIGFVNLLGRSNVADWGLRQTDDGRVTQQARTLPGRRSFLSLQVRF